MIHYIFKSGITNATYKEWALKYEQTRFKPTVIHFADYLKDMLSMLFNIDRKLFDSRTYKDELWYDIHGNVFFDKPKHDARFTNSEEICKDVTIDDLKTTPLAYYMNNYQFVLLNYVLYYSILVLILFVIKLRMIDGLNLLWVEHGISPVKKDFV